MTFRDRLRAATKAATGIFSDTSAQQAYQMLNAAYGGTRGEPPDRGAKGQLESYSTMPRARAAFGLIATAMAAVDWKLYVGRKGSNGTRRAYRDRALQLSRGTTRKDLLQDRRDKGDLDEITEHPALEFLSGGGPILPGVAMRRVCQVHLDSVGEAFICKERNGVGAPVGGWPIPPTWVQETPTPQRPFYRVVFRSWQAVIPEADILWVRDPDPANPFGRGVGYAKALADELEADEYASKTVRQLFFNKAAPDFLLYPKGERAEIGIPEAKRFEQQWLDRLQGYWRHWKPYIATREIGVYEFQKDLGALQFVELRAAMRDTIFQTLGIPPEQLGLVENSNRATIEASDLIFAKNVLVPRLELWRSYYQEFLIPEYDERLIVDYVTPVTEDRDFMLRAATIAPWALTVDEWRAVMGQGEAEEGGDQHMIPFNVTPGSIGGEPMPPREPDRGRPNEAVEPDEDEEPAGKQVLVR